MSSMNKVKDWSNEVEFEGQRYGVISVSAVAGYSNESSADQDTYFEQCYKEEIYDMLLKRGAITVSEETDERGVIHRTWQLIALKPV